jgi:hypothetical protein
MKRLTLFIFLTVILFSCKHKYDVNKYYSSSDRDTLLTAIITYVYIHPQYATWETRFDQQYRKYYISQLPKFRFEKYFIDKNNTHYYYIIRPARSVQGNLRGVGGSFKLDANGKIISFKEIFNTPAGDLNELRTKGEELFNWMVKTGNVNDYVKNPDFIEWPNPQSYYDTIRHEWLIKTE